MKYHFTIFIILSIISWATAQTDNYSVKVKHYQTNDGLSNNYTLDILKDSRGILWVGTYNGLNRFEGKRFQKMPVDGLQLVHQILEDDEQ